MRTSVDSVFLSVKHSVPSMRDGGGGAIVNITSTAGLIAAPNRPAYCASKGAVIALTRQLAIDLAVYRIRVNAVAPSPIEDTGMYQTRSDVIGDSQAVKESVFRTHPLFASLGRILRTDDVARAVLFLASDDAGTVTGVTLPVDGGNTAL
jgi:NAD(P)-dependent dehydrogenase (short-subunit alcohol dehydrogenase family)